MPKPVTPAGFLEVFQQLGMLKDLPERARAEMADKVAAAFNEKKRQSDEGPKVKLFTEPQYVLALEKIGWFKEMSKATVKKQKASIAAAFKREKKTELPAGALFLQLAVTSMDLEMIEGAGPKEENSYYSAIRQLAGASDGKFEPKKISDVLDEKNGQAHVSFEVKGKKFAVSVPQESDWFHPDVFDLVEQALKASKVSQRFQALPVEDQVMYFAFVSDAVFKKAIAAGLIPDPEISSQLEQEM